MLIACDTSSVVCSVALTNEGKVLSQWEASGGQIHIEKLAPFLREALDYCDSIDRTPDALAITVGPGSFNGLRIGMAAMKALALTLDLPLIPIPSTDAMAFGLRKRLKGHCRAVIFSHRNFVHYADYHFQNEDQLPPPDYSYDTWDELFAPEISRYFGLADRGFSDWLAGEGKSVRDKFTPVKPDASQVALLAELRRNEAVTDIDQLEPFYNVKYEAKKWVPPHF